jgi:uncharacterized protein (DUF2062 family)
MAQSLRNQTMPVRSFIRGLRVGKVSPKENRAPKADQTTNPSTKSRSLRKQWTRRLRYIWLRFLRLRGSPEYLARGLAAGVFAGLFPLFGFQTLIGIAIAVPLNGHKLMAAAGTWISNPLTYAPLFFWNFYLGKWLLNSQISFQPESLESMEQFLQLSTEFMGNMMVGSAVMGLICSVVSYFVGLKAIAWLYNQRRQNRRRSQVKRPTRGYLPTPEA